MRHLKPHSSWKHRKLYERFLKEGRKPLIKVFETSSQAEACRTSLFHIKWLRKEKFFISKRKETIFIADKKEDFNYEDSY